MAIQGLGALTGGVLDGTGKQNSGQVLPTSFMDALQDAGNAIDPMSAMGTSDKKTSTGASQLSSKNKTPDDPKSEFMKYMKQTPAERMQDNWLRAHGITKEKFDAMSPEDQQKVLAQMKQEIEERIKQDTENHLKQGTQANIFA